MRRTVAGPQFLFDFLLGALILGALLALWISMGWHKAQQGEDLEPLPWPMERVEMTEGRTTIIEEPGTIFYTTRSMGDEPAEESE